MWALCVLRRVPPAAWWARAEAAAVRSMSSGSMASPGFAMLAYATLMFKYGPQAKDQPHPSPLFITTLLRASLGQLGYMDARSLVMLLTAVANWGLLPGHPPQHYLALAWFPRYLSASLPLLQARQLTCQGLVLTLASLAQLRLQPGAEWMACYEDCVVDVLRGQAGSALLVSGGLSAAGACQVMQGWAQLGYRPASGLLDALLHGLLLPGLERTPAKRLFPAILALAVMRHRVPDDAQVGGAALASDLRGVSEVTKARSPLLRLGAQLLRPGAPLLRVGAPLLRPGAPLLRPGLLGPRRQLGQDPCQQPCLSTLPPPTWLFTPSPRHGSAGCGVSWMCLF